MAPLIDGIGLCFPGGNALARLAGLEYPKPLFDGDSLDYRIHSILSALGKPGTKRGIRIEARKLSWTVNATELAVIGGLVIGYMVWIFAVSPPIVHMLLAGLSVIGIVCGISFATCVTSFIATGFWTTNKNSCCKPCIWERYEEV